MKQLMALIFLFAYSANAQTVLTMDDYLDQVRSVNQGYKGTLQNREGAKDRGAQADLFTAFRLEGNYKLQKDQKLSLNPAVTYDRLDSENYSLGIAKTTSFGLDAKLSYDLADLEYIHPNVNIPGGNRLTTATPTITLTQSLWQNGFGSLTQARIEATAAQAEYERQSSEANLDAIMQKAMAAYWNLVIQREVVEIQRAAVKQSQAIYDYNSKRTRMNLNDRADSLQSKATLETKKLDLQTALDNEEIRIREFNLYRNKPSSEVPGALTLVNWEVVPKIPLPAKRGERADVKAARAQAKASAANFEITAESNRPVLNLFGSYSLNGRASGYGDAISDTSSANRPTTVIGVNLSMPLDFTSLNKAKSGARAQAQAAETTYQQKVLDQEANWQDLVSRVHATQKRVELSESIVKAQSDKLEYERRRLREGRTSTYQVLLFEQDYINARMTRIQNASELVSLISQIRLYDETEEGGSK